MSVTVRRLNKKGSLQPRKCTPAVNCGMFILLVVQQWCDRRDVGGSFRWKRLSCYEVLFISPRTCMVGRKETCRSEADVHFFEIGRAGQYVVARIERIQTKSIANAKFNPGARHQLHQADCATRRRRTFVSSALNLHPCTDPSLPGRRSEWMLPR
jgi:hypothetical protein